MTKETRCLICDSEGFTIRKVQEYSIYKCKDCGLEYTYPLPTEEELNKFYLNYVNIRADDDVSEKNAFQNIDTLTKYGLSQKSLLLDYGCGNNIFTKTGNSSTWIGYDKYFLSYDFSSKKWDFITMWGVLEHLTSPKEIIQELASYLSEKGKIALITITVESNIPFQYKPPEHLTYWTKEAIKKLFHLVGLKILKYESYQMYQKSNVYMDIILRTVPSEIKSKIYHNLPEYVFIPTNEIFVVGQKCIPKK